MAAVVLAAGRASRFGGVKVLARLDGRPILEHVLEAAAAAGLADVVVVLGEAAGEIESTIGWRTERRVRNPTPEAGLSSSLRLGLAALGPEIDAALVLLGDQPRVRADVIARVIAAAGATDRPVVVPRYAAGGGANPALIRRTAWAEADALTGDRGFGALIAARPELAHHVPVEGDNPDIDTPSDLHALAGRAGMADR